MKEKLLQLLKVKEPIITPDKGTWPWLHSVIVNGHLNKLYIGKIVYIQLGIDDVLAQIYDRYNQATVKSVLLSVEQGGTEALGHIIGLMSRHGASWHREEVFQLSQHATQIYSHLLPHSSTEAGIFLDSIRTYHPRVKVQGNTIDMNIIEGNPQPIIAHWHEGE